MTILHSKNSQKGDSDDPPPKKKSKKSKSLIRTQTQAYVSHPTTSSGAGPSHCLPEQIGLYSFLSPPQSYYTSSEGETFLSSPQHYYEQAETELQHYFGQTDQEIVRFKLDKFDVGYYSNSQSDPYSFEEDYESPFSTSVQDPAVPGTSQTSCKSKILNKNQIYNPNCLEYYIYGPGSRSPNSKKNPPKRVLPDVNLIEVISSEEIISQGSSSRSETLVDDNKFEGGSLLDDINNFDIDDKFGELEKFQQEAIWEDSKMYHMEKNLDSGIHMNGYDKVTSPEGPQYENRLTRNSPAASLSNLGNTCFLNSVLYTLRFAPNFLHNLHHLVCDMNLNTVNNVQAKQKTSSLGRNMNLNWNASKESATNGIGDHPSQVKTKKQIVTEKLHEVYEAMHLKETKEHIDSFHPEVFLTALREVNPIFEGNQQQDAHELLVCLLDIFRETCQALARQAETRAAFEVNNYGNLSSCGDTDNSTLKLSSSNINKSWGGVMSVRTSLKARTQECLKTRKNEKNSALNNNTLKKKNKKDLERVDSNDSAPDNAETSPPSAESNSDFKGIHYDDKVRLGVHNFVAQDFEGVMVLQTTCLGCENTTEKKEPFADICVPIKTDDNEDEDDPMDPLNPSDLYQRAVVTDEFLRDRNKYYCEECLRYNEARRSVRYQTLPRLLTLQLKRFSSTYGAMSKVTQYMPTPMTLSCFCEECRSLERCKSLGRHCYDLYGVIMHLGPNMAGGHYIAYVKTTDNLDCYRTCPRDKSRKVSSLNSDCGKSNNCKGNNILYNLFKNKGNSSNNFNNDKLSETKLAASNNFTSPSKICRSLECCGVRTKMADLLMAGGNGSVKDEADGLIEESIWIACDDDNVKVLRGSEVEELLAKNSTSNATPYLLFYSRRTE